MNDKIIESNFLRHLKMMLPNYVNTSRIEKHSSNGCSEVHVYSNEIIYPAQLKTMVEEAFVNSIFSVSVTIKDTKKISNTEKPPKTAVNVILDITKSEKTTNQVSYQKGLHEITNDQNNFSESRISATRPVQFSALLPSQQEELENKSYRERQLMEMMEKIRIKSGEHHAGFPF